jgi:hypothetical protein
MAGDSVTTGQQRNNRELPVTHIRKARRQGFRRMTASQAGPGGPTINPVECRATGCVPVFLQASPGADGDATEFRCPLL